MKSVRYLVVDLGNPIPVEQLCRGNASMMSLQIRRDKDPEQPYAHYLVQRVIPCRCQRGKLHKL